MKKYDLVEHSIFGLGRIERITSNVAQVNFGGSHRLIHVDALKLRIDPLTDNSAPLSIKDKTRLNALLVSVDFRLLDLESRRRGSSDFVGKSEIIQLYKTYKRLIHVYLSNVDSLSLSDYKRLYMAVNRTLNLGF